MWIRVYYSFCLPSKYVESVLFGRLIWMFQVCACVFVDRRCAQAHNDDDGDGDVEWGSIRIFNSFSFFSACFLLFRSFSNLIDCIFNFFSYSKIHLFLRFFFVFSLFFITCFAYYIAVVAEVAFCVYLYSSLGSCSIIVSRTFEQTNDLFAFFSFFINRNAYFVVAVVVNGVAFVQC